MARILRFSPVQRNFLICISLFGLFNVLLMSYDIFSPYPTLSLDEIYDPLPSRNDSNILLISALFFLPQTPVASHETYLKWIPHFLGSITTDLYIYTTPNLEHAIRTARGGLPIVIDTSFRSPFDTPPLKGRETVYEQMSSRDQGHDEKTTHYAARNVKPYLVEHAIRSLQEKKTSYDFVFWNDIGNFKEEHYYRDWPNPGRVRRVWEDARGEDAVLIPIVDSPSRKLTSWNEDNGPIDSGFVQKSFFGGSPSAMIWLSRTFYSYHDHFLGLGLFAGREDSILNSILLLYPSRFITVWPKDPTALSRKGQPPSILTYGALGVCGLEEHYYQWWLSDGETRAKMRSHWMSELEKKKGPWWKLKVPCRLTRAMGVETVLKQTFGEGWVAPRATITKPRRSW